MGKILRPLSGTGQTGLGEKQEVRKCGAQDCICDLQCLVKKLQACSKIKKNLKMVTTEYDPSKPGALYECTGH